MHADESRALSTLVRSVTWLRHAGATVIFSAALASSAVFAADPIRFSRDILPILARNCFQCHGPSDAEAGLRLHRRESALAELETGNVAIAPGDPDTSMLVERIESDDDLERMPLDRPPLKATDIAKLRAWIEQGANWDEHWSFRAVQVPAIPEVRDATWVRNPVDAFILSQLERHGLTPSSPATRRVLIRRVYYDLTGLPPTPAEVSAFVEDSSPDAYERLIEQLLASPQYGEKWARHWLDLVRFAETNSFERDAAKPHAWRYRDYVIQSFNGDKPFDRFIREQIAGDELPDACDDEIIATGYYRLGLWDDEPSDPEQLKYDIFDDLVKTTSQVFMGLTMDCARCHDHKIDPISQRDYYRMVAFFQNIRPMQTTGPNIERVVFRDKQEKEDFRRHRTKWREQVRRLTNDVHDVESAFTAAVPPGSDRVPRFDLERVAYRYFEGNWMQLPDFDALTPAVQGELGPELPTLAVRRKDTSFGLVFTGYVRVPKRGDYTFTLDGDDGVRLMLDGQQILERDGFHGIGEPVTATVSLGYGRVPFRLEYFQGAEGFDLRWSWSGPGFEERSLFSEQREPQTNTASPFVLAHLDRVLVAELTDAHRSRVEKLAKLQEEPPTPRKALCVTEFDAPPPETRVLMRGNPHAPGELVEPGYPEVMGGGDAVLPALPNSDSSGRRTALATWLSRPDHPLIARVMVNRIWQHHFGRGIVKSSNNFGLGGDPPTHPELLDWLAHAFVSSGWSVKEMHRLILTSNTYRMSSAASEQAVAKDPDNEKYSHFDLRRLTAEEIRDSLLAVNGRLNLAMYGPGIYEEIPAEVLAGQSRPGDGWGKSSDEERARRSIYIHVKRSLMMPLLEIFDQAETDNSCPVRFATVQPTQALSLLNSPYLQRQAEVFAERVRRERPDQLTEQLNWSANLALQRELTPEELDAGLALIRDLQHDFALTEASALAQWCLLLYNLNEFVYLE